MVARTHIIKSVESGSIHIKVFWLTLMEMVFTIILACLQLSARARAAKFAGVGHESE